MTSSHPRKKRTSGIALHASTVALSPARSVTSHLRKRYHERYRGKHRFAPVVFGFDLFLLGVLLGLVILNVFWLFQVSFIHQSGLTVSLVTPPLRSADTVPILVRVSANDGRVHDDVILKWRLPEWVEVIRADPPLQKDGSIRFGRIVPGVERESHLLVHIRSSKGASVPFAFTLTQFDPLGLNRRVSGSETRIVESSALVTDSLLPFTSYSAGASLPIIVINAGSSTIPIVTVHVEDASDRTISGGHEVLLGELRPGESRVLLFDPTSASSTAYEWSVLDGAQVVATQRVDLSVEQGVFPVRVTGPLVSDAVAMHTTVAFDSESEYGSLLVIHPLLRDRRPFLNLRAQPPGGAVDIPLRIGAASSTKWNVIAILDDFEGPGAVLGPATEGTIRHTFPLRAEARYFTKTGDQLGIGPTPPRAGEETSYWIVWTVGPADDAYSDVLLSTDLPEGVHATGKFASSAVGAFETDGSRVKWIVPSLQLIGANAQTFAFEVRVSPTKDQTGKVLPLVGTSTATAIDTKTGIELQSDAPGDDTRLLNDGRARGDGVVNR